MQIEGNEDYKKLLQGLFKDIDPKADPPEDTLALWNYIGNPFYVLSYQLFLLTEEMKTLSNRSFRE